MRQALFVAVLLTAFAGSGRAGEDADGPETSHFHFGTVPQGTHVEHRFPLRNAGAQPLRITNVQITPPLQLARMPAAVPAGSNGSLALTLDTSNIHGDYSGELLVGIDGEASPRAFSLTGHVNPPIEILPRPAVFLSTPKGVEKSAALDIINHEAEPVTLSIRTPPTAAYSARLHAIAPGRRYRLTVTIPATAAAGRHSDRLELASSSTLKPIVGIGVNTLVRERVHTFPDSVDFGQLKLSDLRRDPTSALGTQTLMVYQAKGKAFSATPHSTVAGIALAAEPGSQGDRVQVTASLRAEDLTPGAITGTITVRTNDPDFPQLLVPVTGEIMAD